MKNNSMLMPVIVLCLIGLITTGLLAFTYDLTREARETQALALVNENRLLIFPQAVEFEAVEAGEQPAETIQEAYIAKDSSQQTLGYLYVAAPRGYAGDVPVMIGVLPDGSIQGIQVLANDETPGLGKKIEVPAFLSQFTGEAVDQDFVTKADTPDQFVIDAVSGATISSRAVADAINDAAEYHQSLEWEVEE
ncbi:MAG: RnfABCDGE type electron transport complex subunit G [Eubacteriales bacterium]|nr:RnfABCDGE type electron transport complex subunit G [Eubacteriales bacterium]MDD3866511.1 RnfABCDGE type electron transport complex subunit G [Eubacteriales bacterium]MDD4460710.1 RnfABCDGE type electron transport complex subunit G [Eubacteriales bacterium]